MELTVTAYPLNLSVDWTSDYTLALSGGYVVDGRPKSEYVGLSDDIAFVLDQPEGEIVGLIAQNVAPRRWPKSRGQDRPQA
ncbi:MAG: hypothetical protein ACR2K6_08335 [Solirubrobacterales bacterium]